MKSLRLLAVASLFAVVAQPALAADPLVGTWKRPNGTLIAFSGNSTKFCGTVLTGEYKGKSIGCMSGKDGSYKGEINKLDEGKVYAGKAKVSGNSLKLAGCVAGGLICKSETLARQ